MNVWAADFESLQVEGGEPNSSGKAMCLCESPDHMDSTPSCLVDLVNFNFYCFGCQASGSLDDLVQWTSGKVTGRFQAFKDNSDGDSREWEQFLQTPLAFDDPYLQKREVEDWQVDLWKIRSTEDWVIFPLPDRFGAVKGLKVRQKNKSGSAKYLTFGSMPDFVKTPDWNIESQKYTNKVVVTEGLFGLLRLQKLHYPAVTPLSAGRALRLASLMSVSNHSFYIAFDRDMAGYMAASKLLYKMRAETNVFAYEKFFDVDEVKREDDLPAWEDVIDSSWYDYYLDYILEDEYGLEIAGQRRASFRKWAEWS